MLLRAGVAKIVGGTRFFDPREIRDVIWRTSKVVVNPDDDMAALRVIAYASSHWCSSVQRFRHALYNGLSFFSACEACVMEEGILPAGKRSW